MRARFLSYVAAMSLLCTFSASAGPQELLNSLKRGGTSMESPAQPATSAALSSGTNGTVGCVIFNKFDVKQITNRRYRKHVSFLCFSDVGDILGSVLTRKGIPVCTVFGTYDPFTECLLLSGCSFPAVIC